MIHPDGYAMSQNVEKWDVSPSTLTKTVVNRLVQPITNMGFENQLCWIRWFLD